MESLVTDADGLQALIDALGRQGFTVIGPTVRDDAISYAPIRALTDLPVGWGDEQDAGHYRLKRREDKAVFGFAAAAQSAKPVFFPASALMRRLRHPDEAAVPEQPPPSPENQAPYALFGIRSCDLNALAIHDHILSERRWIDADYVARRRNAFVVAVTCTQPGGTCFCASTGTGPRPEGHFDLRLTELIAGDRHQFLLESGTEPGERLLAEIPGEAPTDQVQAEAEAVVRRSRARMGRSLETTGLRETLHSRAESRVWEDVAGRCLSCGNCTLVCPTCFCTSVTDAGELAEAVERRRTWASCFTSEFSYLHGAIVRKSTASRYRQWMTHKFASWIDQFGVSGCVGCGRCITWCPAGIDITAEAAALLSEGTPPPRPTEESP